jgi:hypothetical protein
MPSEFVLGLLVAFILLVPGVVGAQFKPIVLIYDQGLPEMAEGVASILEAGTTEEMDFLVLEDPAALASMLALPNIRCLVLTSVSSSDLIFLREPVFGYFEAGGSAIGFHGSCWETQLGDLARIVFPVYGNSTGMGTRKGELSVNEYVRESSLGGIGEGLPESFDLIGQSFAVPKNKEKELVQPLPPAGTKAVLYKDRETSAPLIVAYEGAGGGRSVAFTGLFVRSNPDAGNYYGRLLAQAEFRSLLVDSYRWCAEGNGRYNVYAESYEEIIADKREESANLIARSEERDAEREGRRRTILIASWVLGIGGIAGLSYWTFSRRASGAEATRE